MVLSKGESSEGLWFFLRPALGRPDIFHDIEVGWFLTFRQ